jgi:hypothetical protein
MIILVIFLIVIYILFLKIDDFLFNFIFISILMDLMDIYIYNMLDVKFQSDVF